MVAKAPPDPRFASWTTERKYEYAARLHFWDGWSQGKAAEEVGISRPRFNEWCRENGERVRSDMATEVEERDTVKLPNFVEVGRRLPPPDEFYDYYFGHWICPDCEVHHPDPDFHKEMRRALRGDDKRLIVNLPPYHSKSTEASVKDTVYDICEDPNSRTIIISEGEDMAKTFLVSIKELLTNRELYLEGRNLIDDWGPFKNPFSNDGWTTTKIYVSGRVTPEKDATVQVLGVGQQIYGRRADKIKFDDIASLKNQRNPEVVGNMMEWIDKECASRVGRNGRLIWVGTRVNPGDIYEQLSKRKGYHTIKYPAIIDEDSQQMLWPDHFPYEYAQVRREEMKDADWMMTYQQISLGGVTQDFSPEALEKSKDVTRVRGDFDRSWILVAGLDLAGGTKTSGYTAMILKGIDLETGRRYHIDSWNVKSMRPAELKRRMLEMCDVYPIFEWRVEANNLQHQLIQYNDEIIRELAARGIKVTPHQTGGNKWDPEFGVATGGPLYNAEMVSIPWGDAESRAMYQPLIDQLLTFPYGALSDMAMADWFSELGLRANLRRKVMPHFGRAGRVPMRVAKRRKLYRPETGVVEAVPVTEQQRAMLGRRLNGQYRRPLVAVRENGIPVEYQGPDPETL